MAINKYPKFANTIPGVQATVNDTAITGTSSSSDKKLMLIGTSEGGVPGQVMRFTNFSSAAEELRSGDLLDAIQLAWNPSPEGANAAGDILALRAQPATQASLVQGPLTFKSELYSNLANQIQVSLTDNLISGTKRLTIIFNEDNVSTTYDNLGSVLTVAYKGTLGYASMEVTHDNAGNANFLVLKAGASASSANTAGNIILGDASAQVRIGDLINAINDIDGFEADFFEFGNHNIATKYLDVMPETPLSVTPTVATAIAGDILNATQYDNTIAVSFDPFGGIVAEPSDVTAEVKDGIATITATADTSEVSVVNFPSTNLAGGSTGVSPSSWASYFKEFANEEGVYYLVPLTEDQSIHAEANAFVKSQSDLANPMRVIVGGGIAESKKESISRAARLNSDRAYVIGNSVKITQTDGTTKSYPGYLTAAMVAGIASGLPKGSSITYKHLDIVGTDVVFEIDDLNSLDSSGVISVSHIRNSSSASNFRLTNDISTFGGTGSNSPVDTEMGVGEDSDMFVSEFRQYLDDHLIGEKIAVNSASVIKTKVMSFLDTAIVTGLIYAYDSSGISVSTLGGDGSKWNINVDVDISRNIKHVKLGITYDEQTLTTATASSTVVTA